MRNNLIKDSSVESQHTVIQKDYDGKYRREDSCIIYDKIQYLDTPMETSDFIRLICRNFHQEIQEAIVASNAKTIDSLQRVLMQFQEMKGRENNK